MTREQLEHLLRASAAILNDQGSRADVHEIVVIGSQSILGEHPRAPAALLASMEADLYPLRDPALAEAIDGAIGELSAFHTTFGYYAQGVGPETATLPKGWLERAIQVKSGATGTAVGLCLETHDLAISKYVAGRDKDMSFTQELARGGLITQTVLLSRLQATELNSFMRGLVTRRIAAHFKAKS
jgi:hypothetical protein